MDAFAPGDSACCAATPFVTVRAIPNPNSPDMVTFRIHEFLVFLDRLNIFRCVNLTTPLHSFITDSINLSASISVW